MNAGIHDEQIPRKILHKMGSVALIFFSLATGYDMSCHGTAPCSWGKACLGPGGDIWVAHHSVHYTQEEGDLGLGPRQSDSTALYCLQAPRGSISKERNDRRRRKSRNVCCVPKPDLLIVLRNGKGSRAADSWEPDPSVLGSALWACGSFWTQERNEPRLAAERFLCHQ